MLDKSTFRKNKKNLCYENYIFLRRSDLYYVGKELRINKADKVFNYETLFCNYLTVFHNNSRDLYARFLDS